MTTGDGRLGGLEDRLQYRFRDDKLLDQALTHCSWARAAPGTDYERLEFLGDRVLALVVAELLFNRFPCASEGKMAPRLAVLVSGRILADVGRSLSLSDFIRAANAGKGPSPAVLDSVVGNCCEAIIGALYVDGGLEAARSFVHRLWEPMIDTVSSRPAKTVLQEWLQGRGMPLPLYRTVRSSGPDHEPVFTAELTVSNRSSVQAAGSTIRAAEQAAAEQMLDILGVTE